MIEFRGPILGGDSKEFRAATCNCEGVISTPFKLEAIVVSSHIAYSLSISNLQLNGIKVVDSMISCSVFSETSLVRPIIIKRILDILRCRSRVIGKNQSPEISSIKFTLHNDSKYLEHARILFL